MAIFIGWLDELAQSLHRDANQRNRIFAAKLSISLTNIWTPVTLFPIIRSLEVVSSRTYLPHCPAVFFWFMWEFHSCDVARLH